MKKLLYLFIFLSFGVAAQPAAMFHLMLRTYSPAPTSSFQPETIAYMSDIIAGGATWDSTGYKAIDTLVRDIKGLTNPGYTTYNIKDSIYTLNPVYGATAYSHSVDLLNVALPKWTFFGSPTHTAANGISFNGTSQYASTNFSLDAATFPLNFRGTSVYHKNTSSTPSNSYFFGIFGTTGWAVSISSSNYFIVGFNTVSFPPVTAISRFTSINRYSASSSILFKDATNVFSTTDPPTNQNYVDYVGCANIYGGPSNYLQYDCVFFSHHHALDATQEAYFYQIVQAYQTRLSRQIP